MVKIAIVKKTKRHKLREKRFRNAVRVIWGEQDKCKLRSMADKLLSIWAGEFLWKEGYGPDCKEMRLIEKMFDYHLKMGTATDITADDAMSIRRYCYQFAKLADRISDRYEDLEEELRKIKGHPLFLILELVRGMRRYLVSILCRLKKEWHYEED